METTPLFRLPWIGRSFNIEIYSFICYSALEDCDGSRTVPIAAFHFQFEHSTTNGILQTMRLKPGHVFDVGQLKLEVHPLVCYTGNVSVCLTLQTLWFDFLSEHEAVETRAGDEFWVTETLNLNECCVPNKNSLKYGITAINRVYMFH